MRNPDGSIRYWDLTECLSKESCPLDTNTKNNIRFLIGLSLWKWFLWICFLFRLSRLDLDLIATHPDKHGGIGFLGMSPLAIAPTVFVCCGAIGSTWRTQILDHGAHLMSFKTNAIVLLVIMLIVAAVLALFGYLKVRRIRGPQKTIETVKEIPEALTPGRDRPALSSSDGKAAANPTADPSGW